MEFKTLDDLKKYLTFLKKHRRHPKDYVFGIELEGALVDKQGEPLNAKQVIPRLNEIHQNYEFSEEAGACQIEIKSYPREFSTEALREKEEYLIDVINDIVDIAEKIHKKEVVFLLTGSNPHPKVLSDKWITDSERAKKMAQWRSKFPPIPVADMLIKPQHIASAIQSIHVHINGKNPDDVVSKYNRLLYMSPELIALSANSPIIGGKLVDYAEARLLLYEMADGGKGGFPDLKKYPKNILEYAEYLFSKEKIIATTLSEIVKERHEDIRIQFELPFRVENRVCAVQAAVRENLALIEYIIGRLKYAQRWGRQQLPSLREIEINRIEAIKNSMRGRFVWNGKSISTQEYLRECIEKAEKGIRYFYDHPRYLHILKTRVERKKTSADIIRNWYKKMEGETEEEKIAKLVNKIWKHTLKNKPLL